VYGVRAGEALLVAVAESPPRIRLLETVAAILGQALRAFDLAERDRHRDERIKLALSWVAHELRGPVLAVKAAIEHSGQDPELAPDLLDRSVEELEVLATMIDGWLAWAGPVGPPPTGGQRPREADRGGVRLVPAGVPGRLHRRDRPHPDRGPVSTPPCSGWPSRT
jgi:hypothetical protein